MKWFAKLTGEYTSSAKVVDGALILSLPDAMSPVVWRMDLGKVKSSAMELQQKEDGSFVLVLKTPKGETSEVAPFDTKAKALRALMSVSHAMENATHTVSHTETVKEGGQTVQVAPAMAAPQKSSKSKWVPGLVGVVVLAVLMYVLITTAPTNPIPKSSRTLAGTSSGPEGVKGSVGVAQDADDFLRGR